MKIGFIGDTHFGAGFNLGRLDIETQLNSRLLDFSKTFDSIIDNFHKNKVKIVVITGDIFETRHPTPAQMNLFSKCIQRAILNKMNIIIVVGNHDQQRTSDTTTVDIYNSLQLLNVKVFSDIGVYTAEDEKHNPIHIILMPYRDRKMMESNDNAEAVSKIQNQINFVSKDLKGKKIAVGHYMIDKAITGQDGENFSISEIILPNNMFVGFDAVVMGHVHQHEILKQKNPLVLYCGSMEKISFGERSHQKVTVIIDTNNLMKPEVISTNVRNLYEMNFDYSTGDKYYKHQITDYIIADIEDFNLKYNLKDAIVKLIIKIKECDSYHINQEKIREVIISKKVKHLVPFQISSVTSRTLRNKEITETVDERKAFASFIESLSDPENIKKKLLKAGNVVIEEVEGK